LRVTLANRSSIQHTCPSALPLTSWCVGAWYSKEVISDTAAEDFEPLLLLLCAVAFVPAAVAEAEAEGGSI